MISALNIHHASNPDPASVAACRDICRKHARGLFLASFFLPRPKREAIYTIGAFGWLLEQTFDPASCPDDSIQDRIDLFRNRLDEIYDGRFELRQPEFRDQTQHILAALADTVARYEIPRQHFLDWAEALSMDRTVRRYATWTSLEKHCQRRTGSVASVMSAIFGMQSSDGPRYAIALGTAIRLTGILIHLKTDRQTDRIYLPLEDLARFGYTERDLTADVVNPAFGKLMSFEIARARALYRAGAEGMCWLADDGSRAAASAIALQSSAALTTIERQNFDVYHRPVNASFPKMLLRLPTIWRLARRTAEQPLPQVF
jgi:phytoene synthase